MVKNDKTATVVDNPLWIPVLIVAAICVVAFFLWLLHVI
jgi:hypothetical protein